MSAVLYIVLPDAKQLRLDLTAMLGASAVTVTPIAVELTPYNSSVEPGVARYDSTAISVVQLGTAGHLPTIEVNTPIRKLVVREGLDFQSNIRV